MKIAIPNNNKEVNQHFGRSTSFIVASIDDKKVLGIEEISTTQLMHQHEGLANLLTSRGVKLAVVGGIGAGALSALENEGIEVIKGASGNYEDVLNQYINGTLVSNEDASCSHDHGHHHH